jgi:hypothetical protein
MGHDFLKGVGERRKSLLGEDLTDGSISPLPVPSEESGTEAELDSQADGDETDDEGDLEVDVDRSFEFLSEGKGYVTPAVSALKSPDTTLYFSLYLSLQAIRNWDLIRYLLQSGRLSETDLNRTLTSILSAKRNQFALHNFRQCMDEILMLCGFNIEGYESRLGTDYGEGGEDTEVVPTPEDFKGATAKDEPIELPPEGSGEKRFIIPYR